MEKRTGKLLVATAVLVFLAGFAALVLIIQSGAGGNRSAWPMLGWPLLAMLGAAMMPVLRRARKAATADEKILLQIFEESRKERKQDAETVKPPLSPQKDGRKTGSLWPIWVSVLVLLVFGTIAFFGVWAESRILAALCGIAASLYAFAIAALLQKNPKRHRRFLARVGMKISADGPTDAQKDALHKLYFIAAAIAIVFFVPALYINGSVLIGPWLLVIEGALTLWLLAYALKKESNIWIWLFKILFAVVLTLAIAIGILGAFNEVFPGGNDWLFGKMRNVFQKVPVSASAEKVPTYAPPPSQLVPAPLEDNRPPSCKKLDEEDEEAAVQEENRRRIEEAKQKLLQEENAGGSRHLRRAGQRASLPHSEPDEVEEHLKKFDEIWKD